MEDIFIVRGGKKIEGEMMLPGSKNVALKVIIGALLFQGKVVLNQIPDIADVHELLRLIYLLDGKYTFHKNTVTIQGNTLEKNYINLYHGSKVRVSFMFLAPLLYLFGKAEVPNPGGCRLGERGIDRHIDALKKFGVSVYYDNSTGYFKACLTKSKLHGCKIKFTKPTHTGTEFAIMLGVMAEGETIIEGASLEPEIDDLINFFISGGGKIKRIGKTIHIKGPTVFRQREPFSIQSDRNVGVTYAVMALASGGSITFKNISSRSAYEVFIDNVLKTGGEVFYDQNKLTFRRKKEILPSHITTSPHPGFMTDWQGPWAVLMTQANGISTIHETIFENRFGYVSELKKLGADISFYQPYVKDPEKVYSFNIKENMKITNQAIRIRGKTKLHNGIIKVSDLRAGATLLIAAGIAEGESIVEGASIIDRGYERIDENLRRLGMDIKRI